MTRIKLPHLWVLLGCAWLTFTPAMAQTFRIGVIADETTLNRVQPMLNRLAAEIQKTVGVSRTVEFAPERTKSIGYDGEKARTVYRNLEGNSDLILLVGTTSIRSVLELPEFTTPTLGIGVFDPKLQAVPYTTKGTSGRKNFTYILTVEDLQADLRIFREMVEFRKVAFLYSGQVNQAPTTKAEIEVVREIERELDIEIEFVAVDETDLPGSLTKIGPDVEAALLVIAYELDRTEAKQVAGYLIDRKIPSFSINKTYVEQGILASNSDDNGFQQLSRKLAVMVDEIVQGAPLAEMKVNLNFNKEVFLNMTTARRIDYSPPFDIIFTSNLLGSPTELADSTYSLMDIIKLGLEQNLDIRISQADIALTEQDVRTAVSQFLPDADYSATAAAVNKNNANALLMRSQYSISGSGSVSQLIYSEQAIANIRIQKLLNQAQNYATDQQILDVTQDITDAYLNILNAKANVQIQRENLDNSKANLELARIRANLGAATNADVFRWQGEVATGKQNLVEAQTSFLTTKAQLNALLNGETGLNFAVEDVLIDGALFQSFANSQMATYVKGPYELELITEFLVQESQTIYPTKKQLNANLDALARQRILNRRLYYTPVVAGSAQFDNTFWRGGEGSTPNPGMEFVNSSWSAGLNVSIPIFDGNRRAINLQTTKVQQAQLGDQIMNLDRQLEFLVRANTLQLLAATTNIRFSRESADNTAKNYELVQNLYRKGQVNIIQLLDAQSAALNTKLAYALSIYEYIQAFIQLENTLGSYSFLSTPEADGEFLDRWNEFLDNKKQEDQE
ncbi:MAG: ABC transporter substrate binding protein [Bacteroidota bacterium]